MRALLSLESFVASALLMSVLLIGLAARAPTTWYSWSPSPAKLLGRWRFGMAATGASVAFGGALGLALLLLSRP